MRAGSQAMAAWLRARSQALAAWLRGDGDGPVPLRLWVGLVAWPLSLFAFFVIPESSYLNAPPLFAAPAASPSRIEPVVPQPQVKKIAVLTLKMEGETPEEGDPARDRRTRELRERVGTNILHLSGYLADASLVVDSTQYPPQSYYVLAPDSRALGCASTIDAPVRDQTKTTRAAQLAVAIVAVEKFNRNAVQRWAEWTYARLHRAVLGQVPDLSYGPAQVRPSLLRHLAKERPDWPQAAGWTALSDDKLLELLFQECKALGIAATFALDRIDRGEADTDIAAAYAGQRRRSAAPIDYAGIVQTMVEMMGQSLPAPPAPTVEPPAFPSAPIAPSLQPHPEESFTAPAAPSFK